MSLSGNYVDAQTACEWGLLNRVVEAPQLLPECCALARDIAGIAHVVRGEIKRLIGSGLLSLQDGLRLERDANQADWREGFSSTTLASNRSAIQARGRRQNSDSESREY